MAQLSEAPLLTFHESFEICPIHVKVFTDIRDFCGIGRVSLVCHDTTITQALGPGYHEWISHRPSFQKLLLSNHRLEMTDTEDLPDDLQFCRGRRNEYFPSVFLKPVCRFVPVPLYLIANLAR